ncbi:unnamed protein product [Brassica oleracea]
MLICFHQLITQLEFRDYTKTIFDGRCHRVSQVCTRS